MCIRASVVIRSVGRMIRLMDIRPATPADVPAVLPLVDAISRLHESWDPARFKVKSNVLDSYRSWLTARATDARAVFLVAERESRIVAYLIGTIEPEIPIYWTPECGWIHDLWVDALYRNEGVGRQMTTLAVERFRALGVSQLRLQTAAANDTARALFMQCGFRTSTVEMLMEI